MPTATSVETVSLMAFPCSFLFPSLIQLQSQKRPSKLHRFSTDALSSIDIGPKKFYRAGGARGEECPRKTTCFRSSTALAELVFFR